MIVQSTTHRIPWNKLFSIFMLSPLMSFVCDRGRNMIACLQLSWKVIQAVITIAGGSRGTKSAVSPPPQKVD